MRRIFHKGFLTVVITAGIGWCAPATAQIDGGIGGQSGMSGAGMGRSGTVDPGGGDTPAAPIADRPEAAAKKAFKAGTKSFDKAKEYESAAAGATNPDKRAAAVEKMEDAYNRALDQFTEALSANGDMFEAWNNVGYIHLRLGAYAESVDDYNHTLALKADLPEAIEHRGEAYLGVDRLEEAQAAYMDLFNHQRPFADQLLAAMQKWLSRRRSDANGMRASDIDAFDKWLQERDGIAKQTASLPPQGASR